MRTVRTVAKLRAALGDARGAGSSIGLVPTMGALHAGHESLIRRAHAEQDVVVVSLFVNPTQFDDGGDLAAYPRDESHDAARAADAGADLLFAPAASEVYPPGFCTAVSVGGLGEPLEGAVRGPGHFAGVATVVLKLLNMVQPTTAYFGQKDAQQALVVRCLVRDLDVPVEIAVCPTVREPDGLAMSSRNARLGAEERPRAVALDRALRAAESSVAAGEREASSVLGRARAAMAAHAVEPEYLALVHTDTLAPLDRIDGEALLAVAARVGETRLIDNVTLTPPSSNGRS